MYINKYIRPIIMTNSGKVRICKETGKEIQIGEVCMFFNPNKFFHKDSNTFSETEI